MKYCTVTGSMTKGLSIESNNHMCAERQIIKQLYRECFKRGYKSHQFSEWVHRKYGHLVICRKTVEGMQCHCLVFYVGKPWKDTIFVG